MDAFPSGQLGSLAARGAVWSGLGTIVLRLGGLVVGIILARTLTPEQFGVYAIALTVQAILMTVADLGLSADLIRSEDPDRIAPTVATLGLVSGTVLTVGALWGSGGLAEVLGSPQAAPAIALLSFTLLLGGATTLVFEWAISAGAQLDVARTWAVNTLVMGQVFYLFTARFSRVSALRKELFTTNPISWLCVGAMLVLQLAFVYLPFAQAAFHTTAVSPQSWLLPVAVGVVIFAAVEIDKALRRGLEGRRSTA